jgi:hypothetical protein
MTKSTAPTRHQLYLLASNQADKARAAGYSLSAALAAGYSLSEALAAGYSLSAARAAGYSLSAALAAGYSLSAALAAGYSLSEARAAGYSLSAALDETPLLENPYTQLLEALRKEERVFKQSTFGPGGYVRPENICRTPMCSAGHLVSMGGPEAWKLMEKFEDFALVGAMIHEKAHPGWPCQNFGEIPDAWALAYIEEMAEHEANGTIPVGAVEVTK